MNLGREDEYQEFKVGLAELDVGLKSLSAMLNRHGKGSVYFGVNNDGSIKGLTIGANTLLEIRNKLTQKINPKFYNTIEVHTDEDKTFIKISGEGVDIPYSFDGRYYIRNTDSDEQASNELLKRMLLSGNTDIIREKPSHNQQLTFTGLLSILESKDLHVDDTDECFHSLNLFNSEDKLNLMAYLLSDQNSLQLKVVVFEGTDKLNMNERTVFENQNLVKSVNDVLDFVKSLNATKVDLSQGERKEVKLFPYDAFREAWINATLHCSWAEMIPPSVFIFDDRIEVVSYGHIPYNLTLDDFYKGLSKPVNLGLLRIFNAVRLSEQTGHGNPTIVANCGREAFSFESGTITVTIPFAFTKRSVILRKQFFKSGETEELVLQFLSSHPTATLNIVADELQFSLSYVKKIVSKLRSEGTLVREGTNRSGVWRVNKFQDE